MKRYKKIAAKKPRVSTKKERFLRAFAKCGIISTASKRSQIGPAQHYRWMKTDAAYPARFADAQRQAIEYLEELLLTQAEAGNTTALIFALKSNCPAKYRENYRVEMSGPNGGPIEMSGDLSAQFRELTDAQLYAIIAACREQSEPLRAIVDASMAPPALGGPSPGQLRLTGPALPTAHD